MGKKQERKITVKRSRRQKKVKTVSVICCILLIALVIIPMTVGLIKIGINYHERLVAIENKDYPTLEALLDERINMYNNSRGMYGPYSVMLNIKIPGLVRGLLWLAPIILLISWFLRKRIFHAFTRFFSKCKGWMQKTWIRFLDWLGIEVIDVDDDDEDAGDD